MGLPGAARHRTRRVVGAAAPFLLGVLLLGTALLAALLALRTSKPSRAGVVDGVTGEEGQPPIDTDRSRRVTARNRHPEEGNQCHDPHQTVRS